MCVDEILEFCGECNLWQTQNTVMCILDAIATLEYYELDYIINISAQNQP